jgi:hypothetical protein
MASMDGSLPEPLMPAKGGAVYAQRHLIYVEGSVLFAQRFDRKGLELTGERTPIAQGAGMTTTGYPALTVANNGVLVYGSPISESGRLTWHDRAGNVLRAIGETADYLDFRISPDQQNVALTRLDRIGNQQDVWIADSRGATSRFTSDEMTDASV